MNQTIEKGRQNYLKEKKSIVEAEYELIYSSPEEKKLLIKSLSTKINRIRNANKPASTGKV